MGQPDSRSSMAVAVEWASKISTMGLEFALPPVMGFGLDRWLGSFPLATVTGAVLGFVVGMLHILRVARQGS